MASYPYSLIPTPPGDWKKSIHDMHAIRMTSLHNILIRSFNTVIYHAPNVTKQDVPSFMKFCLALVDLVHEHHANEEEVIFPYFESKMGEGAMTSNVTQHHDFMPKFEEWSELCRKIQANEAEFNPTEFVALLKSSTDILVVHLVDEIPTMESSILQKHFTEPELRELETRVAKKVQECLSVWTMPLLFVSGDFSDNTWFPEEIPGPVVFFARHIVMRLSGDMWKYGQSDKYSNLKDEFKPMYAL